MATWPKPPPTRTLSWLQMCLQADPDFRPLSLRPWIYEFSNGRLFIQPLPVYGTPYITDDYGNVITDDYGTPIQADSGQIQTGTGTATGTATQTGFPFGQGAFGTTPF